MIFLTQRQGELCEPTLLLCFTAADWPGGQPGPEACLHPGEQPADRDDRPQSTAGRTAACTPDTHTPNSLPDQPVTSVFRYTLQSLLISINFIQYNFSYCKFY